MNFVVYKSVQPHPYAARPWVSSIEATGESRGLSQLINWVSGCFLGKSWNPPKRRQDFWHWEGRAFQPTSMTFFWHFSMSRCGAGKKLPLRTGLASCKSSLALALFDNFIETTKDSLFAVNSHFMTPKTMEGTLRQFIDLPNCPRFSLKHRHPPWP